MTIIFHLVVFLNKLRKDFLLLSSYFTDSSFLIVSIFPQKIWIFHVVLLPFRTKSFL